MKICPSCKKEISPKAETCPACGHPMKKKTSGCAWLFLIGFIVVIMLTIYGGAGTAGSYSADSPKAYDPDDYAITMSWEFIKSTLRSPSTAKFARISEHDVYTLDGYTHGYQVHGHVDSQNGFGAMIRSRFAIDLEYDPTTEKWKMINLQME